MWKKRRKEARQKNVKKENKKANKRKRRKDIRAWCNTAAYVDENVMVAL